MGKSKELNDYSGQLRADLKHEEMSKEFLLKLMKIWQDMWSDIAFRWMAAVGEKLGEDTAIEICNQVVEGMAPAIMPRLAEAAGIQLNTLIDHIKTTQMTIDNKTDRYPCEYEIKSPNRVLMTIKQCETAEVLKDVPELLNKICTKQEARWILAYMNNPKIKMTPLKLPPRKNSNEPTCIWEYTLEE